MKKITIMLVSLIFLCNLLMFGFAQEEQQTTEVIKGKIISIDTDKNEIVIKVSGTEEEKTIIVDPQQIAALKTDEEVKVTLVSGTNTAESVKKVIRKKKSKKHNNQGG